MPPWRVRRLRVHWCSSLPPLGRFAGEAVILPLPARRAPRFIGSIANIECRPTRGWILASAGSLRPAVFPDLDDLHRIRAAGFADRLPLGPAPPAPLSPP